MVVALIKSGVFLEGEKEKERTTAASRDGLCQWPGLIL